MTPSDKITTANGLAVRQAIHLHRAAHADGESPSLQDCLAASFAGTQYSDSPAPLRIAPYSTHPERLTRAQRVMVTLACLIFTAFIVAGVALMFTEGAG